MREILLTSSVLILALLILRRAFREKISRRVQYALWALVLVRLLTPVSLPPLDLSVLTMAEPVRETISARLEAPAVPAAATAAAVHFPFSFGLRDSAEIPADQASRKVVVTVDKIRMARAAIPRPALTMTAAMSDSPVKIAAPMPMAYIQVETRPYTTALARVA